MSVMRREGSQEEESKARWISSGTPPTFPAPGWHDSGNCSNKTIAEVVEGKRGQGETVWK